MSLTSTVPDRPPLLSAKRRPFTIAVAAVCALAFVSGCSKPRRSFRLPKECLSVRYEAASTYSGCLVASVAMAANYVLGDREFSENSIRVDLNRMGLDETRIGDLKAYLDHGPERLHLLSLTGQLDDTPPTGLRYWLEQRGYPVVCVINLNPRSDPAFNHAVVVIGISANPNGGSADTIHYLDPSSEAQLHSVRPEQFEAVWAAGENAMMVIHKKPS